jgi:hypothetical protein
MKLPSLQNLYQGALCALFRFPFALISSILGVVIAIYMAEHKAHFEEHLFQMVLVCAFGIPLFFSTVLFCERSRAKQSTLFLLQIIGAVLLIAYYFSLPEKFEMKSIVRFCLFSLGLHLFAAFSSFIRGGKTNGFWQFNKTLFLRFLTAALYSGVLYVGLSIAILAIDQLFRMKIDGIRYFELWVLLAGVFNTWYFLANIPQNFDELDESDDYPKGLKIFTQFVLLPLVSIYLLILYAYIGRILIQWSWPVGWVSYLVIGFSTLGVFSLLLIFPVQEKEENRWIKIFSRSFFFALFPLVLMLFLAIWRRVSEYGITENRYFIIVLALWLFCIALYFSLKKFRNIILIPVSLCILAFMTSFGPWGAFSVSRKSQVHQLEILLEKYNMLQNGKAIKASTDLPFVQQKQISSVLSYLVEVHGVKSIQPFFIQNLDSLTSADTISERNRKPEKILKLINIRYFPNQETENESSGHFSYRADKNSMMEVKGFDFSFAFSANYFRDRDDNDSENETKKFITDQDTVRIRFSPSGKIIFSGDDGTSLEFNLSGLVRQLEDSASGDNFNILFEKLKLENENDFYRVRIYFTRLTGTIEEEKRKFNEFNGQVLMKRKAGDSNSMKR